MHGCKKRRGVREKSIKCNPIQFLEENFSRKRPSEKRKEIEKGASRKKRRKRVIDFLLEGEECSWLSKRKSKREGIERASEGRKGEKLEKKRISKRREKRNERKDEEGKGWKEGWRREGMGGKMKEKCWRVDFWLTNKLTWKEGQHRMFESIHESFRLEQEHIGEPWLKEHTEHIDWNQEFHSQLVAWLILCQVSRQFRSWVECVEEEGENWDPLWFLPTNKVPVYTLADFHSVAIQVRPKMLFSSLPQSVSSSCVWRVSLSSAWIHHQRQSHVPSTCWPLHSLLSWPLQWLQIVVEKRVHLLWGMKLKNDLVKNWMWTRMDVGRKMMLQCLLMMNKMDGLRVKKIQGCLWMDWNLSFSWSNHWLMNQHHLHPHRHSVFVVLFAVVSILHQLHHYFSMLQGGSSFSCWSQAWNRGCW